MCKYRGQGKTYRSAATTSATSTSATSATATARRTATRAFGTSVTVSSTLSFLTSRLGSAGKLNGNLALENLLAGELSDGTFGFSRGGKIHESVTDRAVGARVLRDRDGFTKRS